MEDTPLPEVPGTQPSLTVEDLVLVAQIIQTNANRGAFRAEELEKVGNLYNKLISFLESVGAVTRAPENKGA